MINKLCLPQWSIILLALHDIKEPLRYTQMLYRAVPLASSHVRSILALMETNGYIVKVNGKDGRIKQITLTPKGERIAEAMIKLKQDMAKNNETPIHDRTL